MSLGPTRKFARFIGIKSSGITSDYDLILIATAHDDYRSVDFMKLNVPVVDTRNILTGDSELFHKA